MNDDRAKESHTRRLLNILGRELQRESEDDDIEERISTRKQHIHLVDEFIESIYHRKESPHVAE